RKPTRISSSREKRVTEPAEETASARPAALAGPAARDIVVIGASAGGIQALNEIIPLLPEDLPAAVIIVVHLAPDARSAFPATRPRKTLLPTASAHDGELIEHGRIYVAPPDMHLLIEDGRLRLTRGPRENGHRPAIDATFRSASRVYGQRVVAVVLS